MTDPAGTIVVGIDGSAQALDAVAWATEAASPRGWSLHLVSSTEPYFRSFYGAGLPLPPGAQEDVERLVDAQLREAVDRAQGIAPDVVARAEHLQEHPVSLLLRMARTARAVAMGASGHGGFGEMLLGSTAAAVAAHASCPVAVVRAAAVPTGPVVVGADGSGLSADAVATAFDEACWRKTQLVAVHACPDLHPSIREVGLGREPHAEECERVLVESLAGWQETYPDVAVERVIVGDRPRTALLEWSGRAQLVVVGSRGRGGFRRLLLGSTSQALLHHAECPVLVVHPRGGADSERGFD
jgi:nucleotide-binding universal stress UspA family protein